MDAADFIAKSGSAPCRLMDLYTAGMGGRWVTLTEAVTSTHCRPIADVLM